jgi:ribitol 2-dehydrogenase
MVQSLKNKTMIVTGASSGIGQAAARRLALFARSADKLQALADELGAECLALPLDPAKPAEVAKMADLTMERFGCIDILFANAGSYVAGKVAHGDPEEWDRVIQLNVNSVFRAVRAVLPHMIARRSGDIVVTSSISGHQAIPWEPVYSATKHAVQSFVHGLRRQVAEHNVRVGSLAPGMVLNELWGLSDSDEIERRRSLRAIGDESRLSFASLSFPAAPGRRSGERSDRESTSRRRKRLWLMELSRRARPGALRDGRARHPAMGGEARRSDWIYQIL